MNAPTQAQHFYQSSRDIAYSNRLFLDMVRDGLTREELQANIDRRPQLWDRWSNWLNKLPSENSLTSTHL